MKPIRWLCSLLGDNDVQAMPTHLSCAQAIAIAAPQQTQDFVDQMTLATVDEREHSLVWFVSAGLRGCTLIVAVDDQTGAALGMAHDGRR